MPNPNSYPQFGNSANLFEPCGYSAQKGGFCPRGKGHKGNCNRLKPEKFDGPYRPQITKEKA